MSLPLSLADEKRLRTISSLCHCEAEPKQSLRRKGNMAGQYYVYIITNKRNSVLYTGVTNDLKKRVYEHKTKLIDGFTKKYNVSKLVYYKMFSDIYNAIIREKQIKGGSRKRKIDLIDSVNSNWRDLYEAL